MGRDGFGEQNALKMWEESLGTITPQDWQNSIIHTKKIISDWWQREHVLDVEVEPLIINIGNESTTSSDESDS